MLVTAQYFASFLLVLRPAEEIDSYISMYKEFDQFISSRRPFNLCTFVFKEMNLFLNVIIRYFGETCCLIDLLRGKLVLVALTDWSVLFDRLNYSTGDRTRISLGIKLAN